MYNDKKTEEKNGVNISKYIPLLAGKDLYTYEIESIYIGDFINTINYLHNKKELINSYKKSQAIEFAIEEIFIPKAETIEKLLSTYKDTCLEQGALLNDDALKAYIQDESKRVEFIAYSLTVINKLKMTSLYLKLKESKIKELQGLSYRISRYLETYQIEPVNLCSEKLKIDKTKC